MRARPTHPALLIPLAVVVAASLAACTGDGGDDPTTTATTTTATATPSESATEASSEPTTDAGGDGGTSAGCPSTNSVVPDDAAVGATADLDGDGQADELWLADASDGTRMLGVRTASGAVFSTDFTSAAPQAAQAIGQALEGGTAIVLLDTGRAVPLYAVIDCELVATQNDDGEQYTFDKGFTGYGTGVGCEESEGGLEVVGYLAETEGEKTTVTATQVMLADGGASASNGESTTTEDLASDDPLVQTATSVSCGDTQPPVQEPES